MTHRASILPLFEKNLVNELFFGFQKKLYKLSKLGGGGGGGNLNKIQKNSSFAHETAPMSNSVLLLCGFYDHELSLYYFPNYCNPINKSNPTIGQRPHSSATCPPQFTIVRPKVINFSML